jgi:transcriptional regulator with XRE-family HTH domain
MGRPERAIDPADQSPLAQFARALRALRKAAGNPTLRALQQRTGFSDSTLSAAMSGRVRPSLDVVLALVPALGGDPAEWAARWRALDAPAPAVAPQPAAMEPASPQAAAPEPASPEPAAAPALAAGPAPERAGAGRSPLRRRVLVGTAAALVALAAVLVGALVATAEEGADGAHAPAASSAPAGGATGLSVVRVAAGREVVVHNVVTDGAAAVREDTAAYLSARPEIYCKSRGCALDGPNLHTSDRLTVVCQVTGDRTTNGDDSTTVDDANPALYTSTLWYGARLSDGRLGYLSEVWVADDDRGGLGLPECPAG